MNTDAIQIAIRSSKTGVEDRQAADDQLSAIVKRNTALEAENAAKDAALNIAKECLSSVPPQAFGATNARECHHDATLGWVFGKEVYIRDSALNYIEAAISDHIPDATKKVLIDIERLRKIEWVSLATRVGVTACPVCGGSRDCGGHADADCWLGNILKEA